MSVRLLTNLEYNSNLAGSTGAKLFKNAAKNKWVVKRSEKGTGGFEQVRMEFYANEVYKAVGIPVPEHILDEANKALILKYIDGKLLRDATPDELKKAKKELQTGFVIDALLANWDVIGLGKDNILLPADGSPAVRIDNGGTFMFRAQGGRKPFPEEVAEIDTMRDPEKALQASRIFGGLDDDTIADQINELIEPEEKYNAILSILPKDLKPIIQARMDYLLDWANGEGEEEDEGEEGEEEEEGEEGEEEEEGEWNNSDSFENTVKETSEPEYIPAVQAAIVDFFRDGWIKNFPAESAGPKDESDKRLLDFINKTLKDNGAVISGGFILKAIGSFVDESSVDIDIYVPSKNAKNVVPTMGKLFNYTKVVKHLPSSNPKSASKAAGIVAVTEASKESPHYAEMDIVHVNDDRLPSDVIKNFDLTFCENWYDGKNVYMAYASHVKTKAGYVEAHYMDKFLSGNSKLIGRLKKYKNRGFKIYIENPYTKTVENIGPIINSNTIFQTHKGNTNTDNSNRRNTKKIGENIFSIPLTNIKNTINVGDATNTVTNINWKNSVVNANTINFNAIRSETITPFYTNAIEFYTGIGSSIINRFLKDDTSNKIIIKTSKGSIYPIYKTILRKFPKGEGEHPISYSNRLNYYYYINLCNAIYSIRPKLEIPIKVYRGTKTWYLNENKDIFHYTNTFCSTSINIDAAIRFGIDDFRYTKLYELYLHPRCIYANIAHISHSRGEAEILLTPYHKYMYIGERNTRYLGVKIFVILPPDLSIPDDPYEFIEWKEDILSMSSAGNGAAAAAGNGAAAAAGNGAAAAGNASTSNNTKQEGGREKPANVNTYRNMAVVPINRTMKSMPRNTTHRKPVSKLGKKGTRKLMQKIFNTYKKTMASTRKKRNDQPTEDTIHRFTDPIPSFPGKPPTKAEQEIIKKMVSFFEKKQ